MKIGKAGTPPQAAQNRGGDKDFGSTVSDLFTLWVDNREICVGTRGECELKRDAFSKDYGVPVEKFTLARSGDTKSPSWTELDGRKFIDLAEVQ